MGETRTWPPASICRAPSGWFTAKYPVSLAVGPLSWAQVVAGDAALGAVVKDAKEQLRSPARRPDLRAAAVPEHRCRPAGSDPPIGFNYLGRLGASAHAADDTWRISSSATDGADAGLAMPLMHTVELNALTVDTDAGPQMHADLDVGSVGCSISDQITRLNRLWFDALARHLRTCSSAAEAG